MEVSRSEQLKHVKVQLEKGQEFSGLANEAMRRHSYQVSHLIGLYQEVEKLAKGKSALPASDLLLGMTNSVIADSKGLMFGDPYLERVKQFVAAGNNPSHADVLLVLRTLQQALNRFDLLLVDEISSSGTNVMALQTIEAALRLAEADEAAFDAQDQEEELEEADRVSSEEEEPETEEDSDYEDEEGDAEDTEEYEECVVRSRVMKLLGKSPIDSGWFFTPLHAHPEFNFARLDAEGAPSYEPPAEGITYVSRIK